MMSCTYEVEARLELGVAETVEYKVFDLRRLSLPKKAAN